MKKALILLLIIFVLTFFLYSSSTAFALNEKEIEISIEGIKYLIKVPIESDIVLKKSTTYYDFVKNKLQDGLCLRRCRGPVPGNCSSLQGST